MGCRQRRAGAEPANEQRPSIGRAPDSVEANQRYESHPTRGAVKSMLVCSTGGHLTELLRVEGQHGAHPDSLWVTFDTPQSRQLLEGRRVQYLPYVGPRDLKGTIASVPTLRRLLARERFDT